MAIFLYLKIESASYWGQKPPLYLSKGQGRHRSLLLLQLAASPLASSGFAAIGDFAPSKHVYFNDFYINFWKNLPKLLKNPPIFANLTHSVSIIIFPLCKFQTFKCNLYLIIFTFIIQKFWKNPPNCKLEVRNEFLMIGIWKIMYHTMVAVGPKFCRIFPGRTGFRIRKTGYPIQKLICVET